MFSEPSAKVFTVFLETLPMFVTSHADDMPSEWLYVCLSRVLVRLSAEQFSSVLNRLHKLLNAVRYNCPPHLNFGQSENFLACQKIFVRKFQICGWKPPCWEDLMAKLKVCAHIISSVGNLQLSVGKLLLSMALRTFLIHVTA